MLDPELAEILETLPAGGAAVRPIDFDWVAYRARMKAVQATRPGRRTDRVDVEDRRIPAPHGAPEVPVRIYRPTGAASSLPALVYFHRRAFTIGDLDHVDRA